MLSLLIWQQKGGVNMSIFISFLVSVAASVVGYYVCKWLDGDDATISLNGAQPSKKRRPPHELAAHEGSFLCEYVIFISFLSYSHYIT